MERERPRCYRTNLRAMNLFCRLFGHTWVPRSDNPKIRWTAAENMSEMQMTGPATVRLWEECARCGQKRDLPTAS
jgi:hypothetical protein